MYIRAKEIEIEFARRSPGTRLIIQTSQGNFLMTREYRHEIDGYDYRLPGGKVFDTLKEYRDFLESKQDIVQAVKEAAIKEAREEAGIEVTGIEHVATSKNGATVVWDLFYFVVKSYTPLPGQSLETGESIEVIEITREEVEAMCFDGRMKEDRSIAILLKYLHTTK